jgi:hypothetical protein
MNNTIQIKYNKGFGYITMIGLLGLLIVTSLIDVKDKRGIIFGDAWIILLLLYCFNKIFLPMLNGKVAMELTDIGIYDYIGKQKATWENITEIRKVSFGKGSVGIAIVIADTREFINDKSFVSKLLCYYNNFFYNTPFIIPMQFLAGSDNEIIEVMQNYFERRKLATNIVNSTGLT